MEKRERIDKLLSNKYNISRNEVAELINSGKVFLGERKIIKAHSKLTEAEVETINISKDEIESVKKEIIDKANDSANSIEINDTTNYTIDDILFNIAYEDKNILIINKKKNTVVYSGAGNESKSIVSVLKDKYPLSDLNGKERSGIVHRLDKDTTGLLIIAKNNIAHKYYEKLFKDRKIIKEYTALVAGNIPETKGKIDMPIARSSSDFKKMEAKHTGKEAITYFEVIERFNNYSLVKINIETGRTHQIRVHLSKIGYPIIGDKKYSKGKNDFNLKSQLLHANSLSFTNMNGEQIEVKASLPEEFNNILKIIRYNNK